MDPFNFMLGMPVGSSTNGGPSPPFQPRAPGGGSGAPFFYPMPMPGMGIGMPAFPGMMPIPPHPFIAGLPPFPASSPPAQGYAREAAPSAGRGRGRGRGRGAAAAARAGDAGASPAYPRALPLVPQVLSPDGSTGTSRSPARRPKKKAGGEEEDEGWEGAQGPPKRTRGGGGGRLATPLHATAGSWTTPARAGGGSGGGASKDGPSSGGSPVRRSPGPDSPASEDSEGGAAEEGNPALAIRRARARVRAKLSRDRRKAEALALAKYALFGGDGRSDSPGAFSVTSHEPLGSTSVGTGGGEGGPAPPPPIGSDGGRGDAVPALPGRWEGGLPSAAGISGIGFAPAPTSVPLFVAAPTVVHPGGARVREAPTAALSALLDSDRSLTTTLAALAATPSISALLGIVTGPIPSAGNGEGSKGRAGPGGTVALFSRGGGWYALAALLEQRGGPMRVVRLGRKGDKAAAEAAAAAIAAPAGTPIPAATTARLLTYCDVCADSGGACESCGCVCCFDPAFTRAKSSLSCGGRGCAVEVHTRCLGSTGGEDVEWAEVLGAGGWMCAACAARGPGSPSAIASGGPQPLLTPTEASDLLSALVEAAGCMPPGALTPSPSSAASLFVRLPHKAQRLLAAILLTARVKHSSLVAAGESLPFPGEARESQGSPFQGLLGHVPSPAPGRGGGGFQVSLQPYEEGGAGAGLGVSAVVPTATRPSPVQAYSPSAGLFAGPSPLPRSPSAAGEGLTSPWRVPNTAAGVGAAPPASRPSFSPLPSPPSTPLLPFGHALPALAVPYALAALRAVFGAAVRGRGVLATAGIPGPGGLARPPVPEGGALLLALASRAQPYTGLYEGRGTSAFYSGLAASARAGRGGEGGEPSLPHPIPGLVVGGAGLLRERLEEVLASRPGMPARGSGSAGGDGDRGSSAVFKSSPFRSGNGGALALAVASHHGPAPKRGAGGESGAGEGGGDEFGPTSFSGAGLGNTSLVGTGVSDLLYPIEHRLLEEVGVRRRAALLRSLTKSAAWAGQVLGRAKGGEAPVAGLATALTSRPLLALPIDGTLFIGLTGAHDRALLSVLAPGPQGPFNLPQAVAEEEASAAIEAMLEEDGGEVEAPLAPLLTRALESGQGVLAHCLRASLSAASATILLACAGEAVIAEGERRRAEAAVAAGEPIAGLEERAHVGGRSRRQADEGALTEGGAPALPEGPPADGVDRIAESRRRLAAVKRAQSARFGGTRQLQVVSAHIMRFTAGGGGGASLFLSEAGGGEGGVPYAPLMGSLLDGLEGGPTPPVAEAQAGGRGVDEDMSGGEAALGLTRRLALSSGPPVGEEGGGGAVSGDGMPDEELADLLG
jgi:hypothetical protein